MSLPLNRSLPLVAWLVSLVLPGWAHAHYAYQDVTLLALSPGGELGLFVVAEGDTEGGAMGETLLIARIAPGITPTGLVSILGADAEVVVAHQEVLPYLPSPGSMMEHSEEQRKNAPGLRAAFTSGPVTTHGVTVDASTRALARKADGSFDAAGRPLVVELREDRSAELRLGTATAAVADPWKRGLACVEAVYRTDDPAAFVVQIFAWEAAEEAACPADPQERFGPPPPRSFFRVVLSGASGGG